MELTRSSHLLPFILQLFHLAFCNHIQSKRTLTTDLFSWFIQSLAWVLVSSRVTKAYGGGLIRVLNYQLALLWFSRIYFENMYFFHWQWVFQYRQTKLEVKKLLLTLTQGKRGSLKKWFYSRRLQVLIGPAQSDYFNQNHNLQKN
jgi:hypothetical protein